MPSKIGLFDLNPACKGTKFNLEDSELGGVVHAADDFQLENRFQLSRKDWKSPIMTDFTYSQFNFMQNFGNEFKGLVFGGMLCFCSNLIRLIFSFDLIFMIKNTSLYHPYFWPASMNLCQMSDLVTSTFTACCPSGYGCKGGWSRRKQPCPWCRCRGLPCCSCWGPPGCSWIRRPWSRGGPPGSVPWVCSFEQ